MNRVTINTESVKTEDYDETRKIVAERFCDHHMTLTGQNQHIDYHHQFIKAGALSFCMMKYGSDVKIDTENNADFYLLQIPLAGADMQQHAGRLIRSDHANATLHMPGDPLHMQWSRDCEKLAIRIERQYLDQLATAICGRDISDHLTMPVEIPLDTASGMAWKQRATMLFSEMSKSPELFTHDIIIKSTIEQLSTSLLLWYSDIDHFRNNQKVLPRHIRRAVEYINENAHLPVNAEDLANYAGVSLRSLYAGFHDFLQSSPSRYLKEVRLQNVRRELTDPSKPGNVTTIATRWGFSQLGRFSHEYNLRFGESPRDTLKSR